MRSCLQCYMWGWDGMDSYHRSHVFFRRAPSVLITYLTLQSLPMWFHWNNRQYNGSSLLLQVSSMQLLGYCARNSTFGEQIFCAQSFLHQLSFLFQILNCKLFFSRHRCHPFLRSQHSQRTYLSCKSQSLSLHSGNCSYSLDNYSTT